MVVVRQLWVFMVCGLMAMDRGSNDCGFDFGSCVVGGGGNGTMVSDCGPIGMGHG